MLLSPGGLRSSQIHVRPDARLRLAPVGLLRAYGGDASPGDLAFYEIREHLAYLQSNGCRPQLLAGALPGGTPHPVVP